MSSASKKQVMQAYKEGKITKLEADVYLKEVHGSSVLKERVTMPATVAILLLLAISPLLMQGDITGQVVTDVTFDNLNSSIIWMNDSFTSLVVSGTLIGEGTANFTLVT